MKLNIVVTSYFVFYENIWPHSQSEMFCLTYKKCFHKNSLSFWYWKRNLSKDFNEYRKGLERSIGFLLHQIIENPAICFQEKIIILFTGFIWQFIETHRRSCFQTRRRFSNVRLLYRLYWSPFDRIQFRSRVSLIVIPSFPDQTATCKCESVIQIQLISSADAIESIPPLLHLHCATLQCPAVPLPNTKFWVFIM